MWIGREAEAWTLQSCVETQRHVLLEGPVGVGKTSLVLHVAGKTSLPIFRVDGDARFTEQKLSGWFDPPLVLKVGFCRESFIPGPLTQAMEQGGILFINELNRLPEGTQNLLLPALDEKKIQIPKLGEIVAKPNFIVLATQNPKDFVATQALSEAICDRFEWMGLDYCSFEDELAVLMSQINPDQPLPFQKEVVCSQIVQMIRYTREDPRLSRGASIRAGLSLLNLFIKFVRSSEDLSSPNLKECFLKAAFLALPTRIEFQEELSFSQKSEFLKSLIQEWTDRFFLGSQEKNSAPFIQKKKT